MKRQSINRLAETQSAASAFGGLILVCVVVWFSLPGWNIISEETKTVPAGGFWAVGVNSDGGEFRVSATETDGVDFWTFYLSSEDVHSGGYSEFLSQRALSSVEHNMIKKNGQIKKPKVKFLDAGTWYFCFYNPGTPNEDDDIEVTWKVEGKY